MPSEESNLGRFPVRGRRSSEAESYFARILRPNVPPSNSLCLEDVVLKSQNVVATSSEEGNVEPRVEGMVSAFFGKKHL